jgi:hypothetical protein
MSRRRRSTYGSYYSSFRRENKRRVPSPWPYFVVALLAAGGLAYFHFVAFKSLSGKVTNAYTGAPMPGVPIELGTTTSGPITGTLTPTIQLTTTTIADGTFHFDKIPDSPVISVERDGFSPQTIDATGKGSIEINLVPNVLSGMITAEGGGPIPGASIVSGKTRVLAGLDGKYLLKDMAEDRKIVVKAPGFLPNSVQVGQVMTQDVTLQPFVAKALYINGDTIATPGKLQGLLDLIDRTELNSVVIDVKADNSGRVLYASELPIVQQLGTADPIISDLGGLLASLKERHIYTIARLSVFWDQAVTQTKPEWSVLSKKAPGQPWISGNGTRWANPYNTEVWDYNIAIAKEVAAKGFDEVQLDFAYFPSVGELDDIDYGPQAQGKKRVDAITGFLDRAYGELSPMGTYVAVNVLAFTPFVQDDMGVGQNFEALAAHVDFICPYLYPSDYPDGFADFAHPAEHPFDVVAETMKRATTRVQGSGAKVRPWLQDFSGKVVYDPPKVRSEIDAAEQNGAAGWMLWNFGNTYTEPALKGP